MAPETVIALLAATLFATAWAMWLLPIGTCSQCSHCQMEKLARERETEAQVSRVYGIPICRTCGRYHPRGEDHRS
jgi:hypothetical protein